jgi:hypothetical protein
VVPVSSSEPSTSVQFSNGRLVVTGRTPIPEPLDLDHPEVPAPATCRIRELLFVARWGFILSETECLPNVKSLRLIRLWQR